jgi:pimeloyl-ACP methyl ester carboxylesterase
MATYVLVHGAGHDLMITEPEIVADRLQRVATDLG